ncbi:MAG: MBL fold metallo-hydrolase [bacterium]
MKSTRRTFIKQSLLGLAGLTILPTFGFLDVNAEPIYKLKYKPDPASWDNNKISLAWIGQSTVLINFYGKIILTDPVLFDRIGVYFFGSSIGPARLTPPALTIDEMPKPDIILLSHAHMDHMDYPTLDEITAKFPNQIDVVVAYLTKDVIEDLPWKSLTVLDWKDFAVINEMKITAYEVKHFGWRYPWEKDRSRGFFKDGRSFNSYLIEYKDKKVFFGGDMAYSNKLDILSEKEPDIAIMPIGAYYPWKFNHCNPEEALQMAVNMKAKYFIPIHTKTFAQGREPFSEPIERMLNAAKDFNIKIGLDNIGQTFVL